MCGISGFVCSSNKLFEETLIGFNELQAHRGPDNQNIFFDGYAGLAHQRLKIIDLSEQADQPMESQCKRFVIIYNGEVYNFKEILKKIQQKESNYQPVSKSDTEIVLKAFIMWGIDFVHKLNGMFAIAIYDKQSRDLFLFRDRLGIKPLYYINHNGLFAFASELKTFSGTPAIKNILTLNHDALNQFLHLGYIPAPFSIYNEVKKLEPGHFGKHANGHFTINAWWKPGEKIASKTIDNESDALSQLQEIVESAISQCLVSDVPFGTFLSGGIDSSLVTAIAQKHSAKPVNTFSIAFSDSKFNEAKYAGKVAKHLNTNHHEFEVTEKDALNWIPHLTEIYDEPFADSSALPTLLVSKLAKDKVSMVLSGDGGDELFMGYGSYLWAERLSNPVANIFKHPTSFVLNLGNSRMKRVSRLVNFPGKDIKKSHIFSQEQYYYTRKELNNLLRPEYHADFMLNEEIAGLSRRLRPAEHQALFDLRYYLPDDLLVKVDRASMHFGLETRVPLLDYRMVEFSLNLDQKLKIKNKEQKYLLKKLLAEYIPKEYFDRPKWGFGIPLGSWMKNDIKPLVLDMLSDEMIKKHEVLNQNYVSRLKNKFFNQNNEQYLYNRLWQLVVLQMWLNRS